MKKLVSLLMVALLLQTFVFASGREYKVTEAKVLSEKNITITGTKAEMWHYGGYIGFASVDLTGINSVIVKGTYSDKNGNSGDTVAVRLDSPTGKILGYVHINKGGAAEFKGSVEKTEGVHDVYLQSLYANHDYITVNAVEFSEKVVENKPYEPIADSAIIDTYHDTWVAADDYGRKIADYEEAGDVREDKYAGMFYWIWHTEGQDLGVQLPSEIIAKNPEARNDYNHPAWEAKMSFWSEPLLGFYTSYDYFVYRRHAAMLKNAEIDVIFLDFTNRDYTFAKSLACLFDAFRDARKAGTDAPKISFLTSWNSDVNNRRNQMKSLYLNYFRDGKYSDLWFNWDEKPLLLGNNIPSEYEPYALNPDDAEEIKMLDEMSEFFTFRKSGEEGNAWSWLEAFPQHKSNAADKGIEAMSVGMAINESYAYPAKYGSGVFSDPYSKGKAYSEGFGDDLRPEAAWQMYFFREQAAYVLENSPEIVLIDGWNEWRTGRQKLYNGFTNAFVDTFDDESSRDFEPSRGAMGDGHYYMLCDFVRKFKGVRPAPVATGIKSIDIAGDISQWTEVGPLFLNDDDSYGRDEYGYKPYHYTVKVINSIECAKVTFDSEKLYFMVKTRKDIASHDDMLRLYINADRNSATGWKGYDYLADGGKLKAFSSDGTLSDIADVKINIAGAYMTLEIPRAYVSETGTVELEFKWVDGLHENGDILLWYTGGSVAPMGRFNYLFTETEQKTLDDVVRTNLDGVSVFMAGSNRMNVEGAKMQLYEADTRVSAIERNGTLYIPEIALNEILGYGRTKTVWDYERGLLKIRNYRLVNDEITDNKFVYTYLDSHEVRIDGRAEALTNPIIAENGVVYVPLTLLSDCFGYTVNYDGKVYTVSESVTVDAEAVASAAELM